MGMLNRSVENGSAPAPAAPTAVDVSDEATGTVKEELTPTAPLPPLVEKLKAETFIAATGASPLPREAAEGGEAEATEAAIPAFTGCGRTARWTGISNMSTVFPDDATTGAVRRTGR